MKNCKKILFMITSLLLLFNQNGSGQDTLTVSKPERKQFKADPQRATMLAIALPGLGQIYNRKYWKIPVVYAGFAGIAYAANFNGSRYNTFLKAYQDLSDAFPETNSYLDIKEWANVNPAEFDRELQPSSFKWHQDQLIRQVDYYRKYRDLSYIGFALWYMVSILDANVDASLFNYDINNDLDIEVVPMRVPLEGASAPGAGVTMRVTF